MRILVLCTGNSCRSQMVEGLLKSLHPSWDVFSAGTKPTGFVHPMAIMSLREIGIDISNYESKSINLFLDQSWDWVITVCGDANENCPMFYGTVKNRIHLGFPDPALSDGTDRQKLKVFNTLRDKMVHVLENTFTS